MNTQNTPEQQSLSQAGMALMLGVGALLMATFLLPDDGEQAGLLTWIFFGAAIVWSLVWTAITAGRYRAFRRAETSDRA